MRVLLTLFLLAGLSNLLWPAGNRDPDLRLAFWQFLIPAMISGASTLFGALSRPKPKEGELDPSKGGLLSPDPIWPWAQKPLGDYLFQYLKQDPNTGFYGMEGVAPYPGQLTPDVSKTMLPNVWNSWSPNAPGQNFLTDYTDKGAWMMDPSNYNRFNNYFQYGGVGGRPTELMNNITQWGGTGGVGNNMMSLAAQYGAPSAAGNYVANMAQFGIPSEAGRPLHNLAMGYDNPTFNLLSRFLTQPTGGKQSRRMSYT